MKFTTQLLLCLTITGSNSAFAGPIETLQDIKGNMASNMDHISFLGHIGQTIEERSPTKLKKAVLALNWLINQRMDAEPKRGAQATFNKAPNSPEAQNLMNEINTMIAIAKNKLTTELYKTADHILSIPNLAEQRNLRYTARQKMPLKKRNKMALLDGINFGQNCKLL